MAIALHHLNRNLEPPEFATLAEHLRDATWLDVHVVDAGLLQRVKIETIHIHRECDTVTFLQRFPTDDEKIGEHRMEVDVEDIMYAVKTELESMADVVKMVEPTDEEKTQAVDEGFEAIKDAAIQAVSDVTGGNVMQLVKSLAAGGNVMRQDMVDRRHLVLWALIEMTNHNPASLCYDCGWRSPMPFQTARVKFTGRAGEPNKWKPVIVKVVKAARVLGGEEGKKWKRSDGDSWKEICIT